jgi:hypothetical protein
MRCNITKITVTARMRSCPAIGEKVIHQGKLYQVLDVTHKTDNSWPVLDVKGIKK